MNKVCYREALSIGADIMKELNNSRPPVVRLLLIDDSEDDSFLLRNILKRGKVSYLIDSEGDCGRAIEMCVRNQHDIYLVDFKLASHDGMNFIREVNNLGCHGPFAIWTGWDIEYIGRTTQCPYPIISKNESDPEKLDYEIREAIHHSRRMLPA